MGWITLAEAQAGANTTESTNAAAKLIAAWLDNQNAACVISHDHPTETVYSRDGITFQQEKDVSVVEYRGLARDLAEFLSRYLGENNIRQWMMYGIDAQSEIHEVEATYGPPYSDYQNYIYYWIGGAGSSKKYISNVYSKLGRYFYPPTDGHLVEVAAQRANAADGWMARATTTDFIAPSYGTKSYTGSYVREINKAFIPLPPNEAWDGVIVSQNKSKTLVAYDGITPVYQNVSAVVREYRYLSLAQASAKVSSEASNASRSIDVRVLVSWGTNGTTYKNVTVRGGGDNGNTAATDKVPTSRPQGHGLYTVSVNEITYQVTTS